MALEFKLPDLGEGVAEGEIVEWKVKVGDAVALDAPLVEVMTDKATVEIPAPQAGVIEKINFEAGAVVPIGSVIVVIGGAATAAAPAAAPQAAAPAAAPAAPTPAPAAAPSFIAAPAAAPKALPPTPAPSQVLATPATRKLARDLGVDLAQVDGSGPRGRVTKEDVRDFRQPAAATAAPAAETATAAPAAAAPVRARPAGAAERTPYRGLRKKIGDQMVKSAYSAPHFTLVEEVDMTEVDVLRRRAKADAEKRGVKVTFLPFVIKALSAALKSHPTMNGILDEAAGEIVQFADHHIGFALDTERGLMVPVIFDAHRKSVFEIAADLQRLSEAGRSGSIAREDMAGSTITVTSAGSIGGLFATPIINHPELAILGVYRVEERPVVKDGAVVIRKMMYLSITLDHRVVDGGEAARFMNTMKRLLGDPTNMILEA